MHREIQIKQFPIVTTHWWPKTRNERFVWENEQYLYCFLPLVHNHVQVIWVRTHIRCVTCVRALWLTLDGGRVWSVVLTQLRGIFLLEDAHCHRSCRFWTVYSRIMMTSFKQTLLLSCIVFLYERSMYPFHSSVARRQRLTEGVSEAWSVIFYMVRWKWRRVRRVELRHVCLASYRWMKRIHGALV